MDSDSILNPFSNKYHACDDLLRHAADEFGKHDAATTAKTVAVTLGIFTLSACVGVLTFGVGGVALFRTLVGCVAKPLPPAAGAKVNKVASSIITATEQEQLKVVFKKTEGFHPHQKERLDRLFQYLTDDTFIYHKTYYDIGFEDNFGVHWIEQRNPKDKEFLEKMRQKYPTAIQQLESAAPHEVMEESRIGIAGQDIRLANNNIFNLLVVAEKKKSPEIHKLLREAMIYSLLRNG